MEDNMSVFSGYHHEERPALVGDFRVEIVNAEEGLTKKTSVPMLTITVRPDSRNVQVKDYIVSGTDFFNATMTEFYNCFGIPEGDSEPRGWIGATGVVRFREDRENPQYSRISRYLAPESDAAKKVAPWSGPMPERQTINTLRKTSDAASPEDDDELPF
jgi:hypothetical protein